MLIFSWITLQETMESIHKQRTSEIYKLKGYNKRHSTLEWKEIAVEEEPEKGGLTTPQKKEED